MLFILLFWNKTFTIFGKLPILPIAVPILKKKIKVLGSDIILINPHGINVYVKCVRMVQAE